MVSAIYRFLTLENNTFNPSPSLHTPNHTYSSNEAEGSYNFATHRTKWVIRHDAYLQKTHNPENGLTMKTYSQLNSLDLLAERHYCMALLYATLCYTGVSRGRKFLCVTTGKRSCFIVFCPLLPRSLHVPSKSPFHKLNVKVQR